MPSDDRPRPALPSRWLHRLVWGLCWLLLAGAARADTTLLVDGRAALPLWPAVSLLADPGRQLTLEQVLARRERFAAPEGTAGNLGRSSDAIWLRVPLQVPGLRAQHRVLEFDYPSLNRIDVFVWHDGQLVARHRLGNQLRLAERPLPTRAHAVALELQPGDSELFVRIESSSSLVLPIALRTPEDFTTHESHAQLLQGVIAGLALCMLAYSLAHWVSLRDRLFGHYALMLVGNMVFTLSYFGIGPQYLWPETPLLSQQVAPLGVLVAVAAATGFISIVLGVREVSRAVYWVMRGSGWAAVAAIGAALTGLIDYRSAQTGATVLGLLTLFVVLPVAFVRARRGERAASYMLFGWAFYLLGAGTIALLLRGYLEPGFWTQYLYPFSSMIEMAAWMGVLGLRVQDIHRHADRARVERDTLRALAATDALTGLPNRRGLQDHLAAALHQASPQQLLAVYLLDLDGFKPVNDRHGHDVGDALLIAVGQRLQAQLRSSDVVARLGGDEFVVLAGDLMDEAAARALGQKMLASFEHPFIAAGQHCEVGLTIGYALAPLDGSSADDLLKRADAAMYAGKQAGRRQLQRGGRKLAAV